MSKNDGGPVFPRAHQFNCNTGKIISCGSDGISLRDYFAANALQGLQANSHISRGLVLISSEMASWAYELADAMIAERDK